MWKNALSSSIGRMKCHRNMKVPYINAMEMGSDHGLKSRMEVMVVAWIQPDHGGIKDDRASQNEHAKEI